jgi:hypothetical protein
MAREKAALLGGAFGAFCGAVLVGLPMLLYRTILFVPIGLGRIGSALTAPTFWFIAILVAFIFLFIANIWLSLASFSSKATFASAADFKTVYTPLFLITISDWVDAFARVWTTYAIIASVAVFLALLLSLGMSHEELHGGSPHDEPIRDIVLLYLGFGVMAFPPTFILAVNVGFVVVPIALVCVFVIGMIRWLSGAEKFFLTLHDKPVTSSLVYIFIGGASGTFVSTDPAIQNLHVAGYHLPALYVGIFSGILIIWLLSEIVNGVFRRSRGRAAVA